MEPWQVALMLVLVIIGIIVIIWFLLIAPAFFIPQQTRDEWERE